MGKVIPFVLKHEDLDTQPTTSLFVSTGEDILKEVNLKMFKKDKQDSNIDNKISFSEYVKQKNLEVNEDVLVKLGMDLIVYFSDRSNFFEVKEKILNKKNSLYKRYIITNDDFKKIIDNISFIESKELPMIVNPLP